MSIAGCCVVAGDDEVLAASRKKHTSPSAGKGQRLEIELTESLLTDVLGLDIDENYGARGESRSTCRILHVGRQ